MMPPDLIEIEHPDFVTVDALGPPGQRTFYLQAGQNDLLVTLVIEKEQAAAVALALGRALEQLGIAEAEGDVAGPELVQPFEPLFRVGQLKLGYDEARDMLLIIAEELAPEEQERRTRVHIWVTRQQAASLIRRAMAVVSAGRPTCPLCHELISPHEPHVCVKGNGRKRP